MKVSKFLVFFSVVCVCCFSFLFVGCDNGEEKKDFNPSVATNLLDRLEVEDDSFVAAINAKYTDTTSAVYVREITKAIEEINSSVSMFIESYSDYKVMFASSEYEEIFSYSESGFKYQEDSSLIKVSIPKENTLSIETGDDECFCNIEIVYIKESNYAIKYFIQESGQDFGEEILCYFDGSSGRITKRSCLQSQTNSIIQIEDYTNFAQNTETGYYYFT